MTAAPEGPDRGPGPRLSADVLIVGSGAGGGPTAALLAEAGFDVLVLEEGAMVRQGDVAPFSLEQMDRQYRAGGVTAALGLPSIAYTEACCAGGGTEVNSGLYRRPPEEVLERWRTDRGLVDFESDELYRICDEVERELSVQTVPGTQTPASEALRRGAAELGWHHDEIPRWMSYPDGTDARSGRRQSMTETYLPRAEAAGARLLTDHRVDRLIMDGNRAIRAQVSGPAGTGTADFAHVVVCGGAIQTPALLQRSGLRRRIGGTLAVHPTVKLAARFDEAVNVVDDVPVHQVKEFAPDLSFGGSASPPGLVALALSDDWGRFGRAILDWEHLAVYYAAITSEGRGRVTALPGLRDPLVTYRLTRRDRALLNRGLARLALLLLEAGATEVYPSYRGAPVVRRSVDLATLQATFAVSRASVMTVHLCSTVPFGEDDRAAADSFGRLHGIRNVHVNDASLLPDAPGVNPQASVMAVAIRNARRFIESVKR
ncbi:MAG TPA: GMC family oxidoreductase [Acidimicrobiales bacterium]|nr:GMC family oxidoreductase [Acidimicrobiales bacterium]